MICIYQADSNYIRKYKALNDLLRDLPAKTHERANRYKFAPDAYNFALGRLLLKAGLEELKIGSQLEQIEYQESGKPFLRDVFFNISHTENLVVCALSTKGEIGIDIEKVKQVSLADFNAWFTEKEWAKINSSPSPLQKFYWYWTRKESIIKALGVNLSYLHKIEIDASKDHFIDNGKKWWLKNIDFGTSYYGALCSEIPISDLRQITSKNLNLPNS